MAVPTKTDSFQNLTTATFTAVGSPLVASDQHGTNNTYDMDESNDLLTTTETPIGTGKDHSLAFWMFIRTGSTGANMIISQTDTTLSRYGYRFFFDANNAKMVAFWDSGAGANLLAESTTGTVSKDVWIRVLSTVDGTTNGATSARLFLNGLEPVYSKQEKAGGGYTGPTVTPSVLIVGAERAAGGNHMRGIPSRIDYWEGTILTPAQALEEYNNELAAIGAGGGDTSIIPGIIPKMIPSGLISSRLIQ